ncbi:hypothetical protein WR164_04000 [Philodulcilactobacillus myokoensis]|uniref:CAAX prenyl protease 2/Lysostaphin resistance protein A-like domain-containing protein n=1 Tax=Philodulcilactobacillus myokoensis TaxID=2929573 RepID=A0A9W6B0A9_9LACO|nr:CPBP family intramembrane glutamic endopeptidase [Philodulcilactobacillus myokoensis]GLB46421.1 hypothetical protein WR164_04000 [Philodulcilactobacillus myokoensis]
MVKTTNFFKILASWIGIIVISFLVHLGLHPFNVPISVHLLIQDSLFVLFIWFVNHKWYHQTFHFQRDLDAKNNVLLLIVVLAYNFYIVRAVLATSSIKHINFGKLFLPALIIAVCAGVAEEFIFRGLIFTYVWDKVTDHHIIPAAVISSLLFGMTHYINLTQQTFSMTTLQVINAFSLGLIFVAIYVRTKNLLLPMFLHFLNDFVAYFSSGGSAVEKLPHLPGIAPSALLKFMFLAIIIKSIIFIIIACVWMRKSKVKW